MESGDIFVNLCQLSVILLAFSEKMIPGEFFLKQSFGVCYTVKQKQFLEQSTRMFQNVINPPL